MDDLSALTDEPPKRVKLAMLREHLFRERNQFVHQFFYF